MSAGLTARAVRSRACPLHPLRGRVGPVTRRLERPVSPFASMRTTNPNEGDDYETTDQGTDRPACAERPCEYRADRRRRRYPRLGAGGEAVHARWRGDLALDRERSRRPRCPVRIDGPRHGLPRTWHGAAIGDGIGARPSRPAGGARSSQGFRRTPSARPFSGGARPVPAVAQGDARTTPFGTVLPLALRPDGTGPIVPP